MATVASAASLSLATTTTRDSPASSSAAAAAAVYGSSLKGSHLRLPGVQHGVVRSKKRIAVRGPSALFGGGGQGSEGKKDDKKFITKEQEPEQYWQTSAEKEGKNPMQTVLPYIALLTLLSPFAILAVAFANNWIKLPNQ